LSDFTIMVRKGTYELARGSHSHTDYNTFGC
jgi:hypothetical protein